VDRQAYSTDPPGQSYTQRPLHRRGDREAYDPLSSIGFDDNFTPMLIRLGEFARGHMQFGQVLVVVLLLPAMTVVALWFPFGFSLGGFIEA